MTIPHNTISLFCFYTILNADIFIKNKQDTLYITEVLTIINLEGFHHISLQFTGNISYFLTFTFAENLKVTNLRILFAIENRQVN